MTEPTNQAKCPGARNVLLFACSGAANVAEAADQACRQLMYDGHGSMFCLAGLGAGVEPMVQAARDADLNVVVDGCDVACGKKTFDNLGIRNYIQIKVTDLDIEKAKGVPATEEQVAVVIRHIKQQVGK
ncbi:MAG TPA: putative zinc-binding protein [Phycisphaerae bacterium]|nr:putative zinc-binding protein [Phycisphaerae bacterium]